MAANDPSREALADWGKLVLRVSLGVLILLHGIAKVTALVGELVAAVPEPQTYALMLAGLGMLGLMAARRRR